MNLPTLDYAGEDPAGAWLSEKLNGCQIRWRPGAGFFSKNDLPFPAPASWHLGMPAAPLVGELFIRDGFERVLSLIRRKVPRADDWAAAKFHAFDAPGPCPFDARLDTLRALPLPAHVVVVPQVRCHGEEHFRHAFAQITQAGGEGVMLHTCARLPNGGAAETLLRKKFVADAEGEMIGLELGQGRNRHRTGALLLRVWGITFRLGCLDDATRDCPPPVGARVTFSYRGRNASGLPISPSLVTLRNYE